MIYMARPDLVRAQARFYAELLPKGALAFDVGAHLGSRTRALRRAGLRVVALEPQKPFWHVLRATLPRDVVVLRSAAGAAPGQATLFVSPRYPTVSTLSSGFQQDVASLPTFQPVRWSAKQQTEVTTLDALSKTYGLPTYIKIDVEGHEAEVLAGLSVAVSYISIEVIPGLTERATLALDRINALGAYRFNVARGEEGAFVFDDWTDRASLDQWIGALQAGDKPCDVYARLDTGDA